MGKARKSTIHRKTKETDLKVTLNLDGKGSMKGSVGIGFMDHMLDLFARHGLFDIEISGKGDLHIDPHHTVEDLGITLGEALLKAAGDKAGMRRFGQAAVPMEETLGECVLDFCGRPHLEFRAKIPRQKLGEFDTELAEDFFRAVAMKAGLTLHLSVPYGRNAHHIIEALFKAFARALSQSVSIDPRIRGVLSTKGKL
ncbi:imidazoleglycerol-phosphate dehydratase HisB [Candidatus Sumerlaeota bacterium]|nr:imidazoleglycerol-phosphate dehydratase HisB [Candidatus Sumerlaeota bacterium]